MELYLEVPVEHEKEKKFTKDCFEMNVPLQMTFVRPFLAIFLPYIHRDLSGSTHVLIGF